MAKDDILSDISLWRAAGDAEIEAAVRGIERKLRREFAFVATRPHAGSDLRIATFLHIDQQDEFVLIPGGAMQMGVSEDNRRAMAAIDETIWLPDQVIPKPHMVRVPPFLAARRPIDRGTALHRAGWPMATEIFESYSPAEQQTFWQRAGSTPALMALAQIDRVITATKLALPTEIQWEYLYRCGSSTLFPWGDDLPANQAAWKNILLADFRERVENDQAENAFGVLGMQFGELCADLFEGEQAAVPSYENPDDYADAPQVMRGGAAHFEPWKDSSWTLCISGSRWDSQYNTHGLCGARFVKNLPGYRKH